MKKIFVLLFTSCLIQYSGLAQTKENNDTLQIPHLPQTILAVHELFSFVYKENDSLKHEITTLKNIESALRSEISIQENKYIELDKKYNNFPDKKAMELRISQLNENEIKLNESLKSISTELTELKNNQPSLMLSEYNKGKDAVIMELEGYFKNKSVDEIITSMSYVSCSFYKNVIGVKGSSYTKSILNEMQTYFLVKEKLKTKCSEIEFVQMELDLKGLNIESENVKVLLKLLSDRKSMVEGMVVMLQEIEVINKNQIANDAATAKIKRMKLYERLEFFSYNHDNLIVYWPYLNDYLEKVRNRISESENTGDNVNVSDIILVLKN